VAAPIPLLAPVTTAVRTRGCGGVVCGADRSGLWGTSPSQQTGGVRTAPTRGAGGSRAHPAGGHW